MHVTYRSTCRVCGSTALTKAVDLGAQYIQSLFVKPGEPHPPARKVPMRLVRCDPTRDERACGLLQTSCSVPAEILYSRYWYRSGTNRTMREHLRGIAVDVVNIVGQTAGRVLDVGCNDGTLLASFPEGFEKYGIDPSNAVEAIDPAISVVRDRFPSDELVRIANGRLFDVVTSIAVFYDLEDPIAFARAVRDLLSPSGVWVFEVSYMPQMLRLNSYDTICHEHLEYYSLSLLEHILRQASLKLFDVSLNAINGGSIRCYATHSSASRVHTDTSRRMIEKLRFEEFDLELDTDVPYRRFQESIEQRRADLTHLIKDLKRQGKRIHVYGASTKGNTILQFCGLDNSFIDYAADRNPDKYGARTLGTDIPIISEEDSRAMRPDYYLVLPWHFRPEFLQRERATIEAGTSMIFPLPDVEVLQRE